MPSNFVEYFLWTKGLVTVDEAETRKWSKLNLKRLEMDQLPPKLSKMNETFYIHLTKLFLQHNSLSSLPDDFGEYIPRLRVLCLDYNRLSQLPSSLRRLSQLSKLNISHNPLKSLPEVIFSLPNLKELWANSIIGIVWELEHPRLKIPPEIGTLAKLRVLGLRDNGIDRLPPEFSELKSLIRVSLRGNLFLSIPLLLFELPTLVHLNLDYNRVETLLSGESLVKAKELRYLRLRENFITITPKVCRKLQELTPKLKWCLLDGNPHEQSPSKRFQGFFKPVHCHPANSRYYQTMPNQEHNRDRRESENMVLTSNPENDPPPPPPDASGISISASTTKTPFSNLNANSSSSSLLLSSPSHQNQGLFKDQNDEHVKSHEQEEQPRNESEEENAKSTKNLSPLLGFQRKQETSDNETTSSSTWTCCSKLDSQPEIRRGLFRTSDHGASNNIPIRIIDIDESSSARNQSQRDEKIREQNSSDEYFLKFSKPQLDISGSASHRNDESTPSTSFIKVHEKPMHHESVMRNTALLCSQHPEISPSPGLTDIPNTQILQPQNCIETKSQTTGKTLEENANGTSPCFSGMMEDEMKWVLSQPCSTPNSPESPTSTPSNELFVKVQLSSQSEQKPQIVNRFEEHEVLQTLVVPALNCGGGNGPGPSLPAESAGSTQVFSSSSCNSFSVRILEDVKNTLRQYEDQKQSGILVSDAHLQNGIQSEIKTTTSIVRVDSLTHPKLSRRKSKIPFKFRKPGTVPIPAFNSGNTKKGNTKNQEQGKVAIPSDPGNPYSQPEAVDVVTKVEETCEKICQSNFINLAMQPADTDIDEVGKSVSVKTGIDEIDEEYDNNKNCSTELKEWTWHCCPMERVKHWIISTSSPNEREISVGTCAGNDDSFQFQEQNSTSTEIKDSVDGVKFGADNKISLDSIKNSGKLSNDDLLSKPGNEKRRKQITFSDTNSYFGPEQSDELLKNMSTSTLVEEHTEQDIIHENSHSSHCTSHCETDSHSMELIFTSPNPPDSQVSSIWDRDGASSTMTIPATPSTFLNYYRPQPQPPPQQRGPTNFPNPRPSSRMSFLQDLFNIGIEGVETNEDSYFETRDMALELDNSELEYSPNSSDIDMDDEDSESVNWDPDFALREEDLNLIIRLSQL